MRATRRTARTAVLWVCLFLGCTRSGLAGEIESPALWVLQETGRIQDGLPVFEPSPRGPEVAGALSRGLSGALLQIYARQQEYLHRRRGTEPRPAALLLSRNEGGFSRNGFVLEGRVEGGYVDLHERSRLSGRFGAVDQIFPHELAHVMVQQLCGDRRRPGSLQVHAVGVTTDPETAFDEGFAEHMQIMALRHPDAEAATRALPENVAAASRARRDVEQYAKELASPASWFTPRRLGFLLWFGRTEQVQRYFEVTENAFSRRAPIPERLLRSRDPYSAYLLENLRPGRPEDPPKSIPRMLSTEGVVSHFFYRWAISRELQLAYREPEFYRQFGVEGADVRPEENVYLKLIHAFCEARPRTTLEAVDGYLRLFPEDRAAVERIVRETFGGALPPSLPEIWLAGDRLRIGTSLYDQYRARPLPHLFDLNTAGEADLAAVPGMTVALREDLLHRQPLSGWEEIATIPGITPALLGRFEEMSARAESLRFGATKPGALESALSFRALAEPGLRRAMVGIAVAALLAAVVDRLRRRTGWRRSLLRGGAVALVGLPGAWLAASNPAGTVLLLVFLVCALPSAVRTWFRSRSWRQAGSELAAWILAALPAAVFVRPWF